MTRVCPWESDACQPTHAGQCHPSHVSRAQYSAGPRHPAAFIWPSSGHQFSDQLKRIDIRYRSNGGSFMKKEHSCTHLKKWRTKMTSTVQTLRRKMSGILFVLLLQHKKKLILVKNNETETCVKLDPNRILEVEIKINICKIHWLLKEGFVWRSL